MTILDRLPLLPITNAAISSAGQPPGNVLTSDGAAGSAWLAPTGGAGGGAAGGNAYTATTSAFVIPANGSTVAVAVAAGAFAAVGQTVLTSDGTHLMTAVVTAKSATSLTLQNSGGTGMTAAGATMASGAVVTPSGVAGIAGTNGSAGTAGTNGANGAAGQSASSYIAANFNVPAVGSTVVINVANTSWFSAGQELYIATAGTFAVTAISGNSVTIRNDGTAGNAAPTTGIVYPQNVTCAGIPGAAGANGQSAFSTTTQNFTVPNVGSTSSLYLANTSWAVAGQQVFVYAAGFFYVVSVSSTYLTVRNDGATGNAAGGALIGYPLNVTSAGAPGAAGAAGVNAFTQTSADFGIPAINSTVTVSVASTAWLAAGQYVWIWDGSEGVVLQVVAVASSTAFTGRNIGASNSNAPTTAVYHPAAVVAAGTPGAAGTNGIDAYGYLADDFTQPAVGSTVTVHTYNSNGWLLVGAIVFLANSVNQGWYQVTALPDTTHTTLKNLGYPGSAAPSTDMFTGATGTTLMVPAGLQGPQGTTGTAGATGATGAAGANGTQALARVVCNAPTTGSGGTADTTLLTVPSSPSWGSLKLDKVRVAVAVPPTGGTWTVQIGSTVGGTDLMPACTFSSSTTAGLTFGDKSTDSSIGSAFDANAYLEATIASGGAIYVRITQTAGTSGYAPTVVAYAYGSFVN